MTPTLQAIKELEKEGKVTPAGSLGEIVLTSQEMSFVGDEVFDNNLFAPAPA
ncbi:MAG: hypothetical protein Q8O99_05240 [bacterium]|nr:hypothetical protein [bacterium]